MRNLTKILLTAGLAVAFVSFTLAQQGRGGGQFKITDATLLRSKEIQAELKIDDGQKEKLAKMQEKIAAEMKEAFKGGGKEGFAKIQEESAKLSGEFVKTELKPEQTKRFKQLSLQASLQFNGPEVFTREDVQSGLKFTDKQKDTTKTVVGDTMKDVQELMQAAGKDKDKRTAATEKVSTLNKEAADKVVGTFSADQKKAWEEMLGVKFEMKREMFIGYGGGAFGKDKKKKTDN